MLPRLAIAVGISAGDPGGREPGGNVRGAGPWRCNRRHIRARGAGGRAEECATTCVVFTNGSTRYAEGKEEGVLTKENADAFS